VAQGSLRADFYYLLGVIRISIPPLRDRLDDMPALVRHFMEKHCRRLGRSTPGLSREVMDLFRSHLWPGNIRELEHALEAILSIMDNEMTIGVEHVKNACPEIRENSTVVSGQGEGKNPDAAPQGQRFCMVSGQRQQRGTYPQPGMEKPGNRTALFRGRPHP
jgi:transcriptional regulator with PAS, ATPase and Fis domain